ncbi:exodeoxyribonuclease VII large subunit [Balneolaceae bacterium ANBcel3]|nr:exodeoxyribonuclease VII large subunit [Balneolaceae bacterium ANBcel3]
MLPNGPKTPAVLSVSSLTEEIKFLLEDEFQAVSVRGEISQPKTSGNGHVYFTLKDNRAQLPCVVWSSLRSRLPVELKHGDEIIATGSIQLYAPHGRYQLIVNSVQPAGEGALQIAFERLKRKLENEGLFDPAHKKPLPTYPETIGVITSAGGAAFHDIKDTIAKRFPMCTIKLWHASVQGSQAVPEIVAGIRHFIESRDIDLLIVGRGGGSLEDLWAFNEEAVARAIFEAPFPVISAVGHETDFSISDFTADVRAATPTQAALLAVPDASDLRFRLDESSMKAERLIRERLTRHKETVTRFLDNYVLYRVKERIQRYRETIHWNMDSMKRHLSSHLRNTREKVGRAGDRLPVYFQKQLFTKKNHLAQLQLRLEKVNPKAPLEKGFTRILQNGEWIRKGAAFDQEKAFGIEWIDRKVSKS